MNVIANVNEELRFKKERKIGMSVHHNRGELVTEKNLTDGTCASTSPLLIFFINSSTFGGQSRAK